MPQTPPRRRRPVRRSEPPRESDEMPAPGRGSSQHEEAQASGSQTTTQNISAGGVGDVNRASSSMDQMPAPESSSAQHEEAQASGSQTTTQNISAGGVGDFNRASSSIDQDDKVKTERKPQSWSSDSSSSKKESNWNSWLIAVVIGLVATAVYKLWLSK